MSPALVSGIRDQRLGNQKSAIVFPDVLRCDAHAAIVTCRGLWRARLDVTTVRVYLWKTSGGMDVCWADLGKVAVQLELPALAEARLEWALDGDLSEMEIFRQPSAPPADDRWCSNLAHHRINAWRNNQNRTQGL